MKHIHSLIFLIFCSYSLIGQDTTVIQTLTYDSTGRSHVFSFPPDDGTTYSKIVMQYSMRCKDGLISNNSEPNKGCGEWDYSCNTYIHDSSQVDSLQREHPDYLVSGFSGEEFNYSETQTYQLVQYEQHQLLIDSIIADTQYVVGANNMMLDPTFDGNATRRKTQYLYQASELVASGLSSGLISGMILETGNTSQDYDFVTIRLKHKDGMVLSSDAPDIDGFTEVYSANTTINAPGLMEFNFTTPFNWVDTKNLLVEISYTNSVVKPVVSLGGDGGTDILCISSKEENHYLSFMGSGGLEIPTSNMGTISSEITMSFWVKGDNSLPLNTYTIEGVDADSRRQVNVHLPWSNSRVYWDCGNDGSGYDRIDKDATSENIKGRWNHWAFTKNTSSGEMKIFLNGNLWHSGTGFTREIDLQKLVFGASYNMASGYYGGVDELRIWDKELDELTIRGWMHKTVDGTHPNYSNLLAYFPLNEGSGNLVIDNSPGLVTGTIAPGPVWRINRGEEKIMNFEGSQKRPKATFRRGDYQTHIDTTVVYDTLMNPLHSVVHYFADGTDLGIIDTVYYYQGGEIPIIDENGNELGSHTQNIDGTIDIQSFNYFTKSPMKIEIMSFVTPYGKFLDMGINGKMWEYDMTDYTTILRGDKRMTMERGGQNQEQMDIRFLFIEGTPTRDVLSLQQIWPVTHDSYGNISANNRYEPRSLTLDPSGNSFKVLSTITGHGGEGEFISQNHKLNIDGGAEEFIWPVWKYCGQNPVYPQGGTWIFDRAGWCPGAASDTKENYLDEYAGPGSTVELDYSVGPINNPGDTRYIVNHQLVSYGTPNFTTDASLERVLRPSDNIEFGRLNPVCLEPLIKIKNNGTAPLMSVKFNYSVEGGPIETYTWMGNLNFLEMEEIALPITSDSFWTAGTDEKFTITIENVNASGLDDNQDNDVYHTSFELPDTYEKAIILQVKTNNRASQNNYSVKDANGTTIFSRFFLSNNTIYEDVLEFNEGCYVLDFKDSGDDGLDFWYWAAVGQNVGTGTMEILDSATTISVKTMENDFGGNFIYEFSMQTPPPPVGIDKGDIRLFSVYPNPSEGQVVMDLLGFNAQETQITLTDMQGKIVFSQSLNLNGKEFSSNIFDFSEFSNGLYVFSIELNGRKRTKKIQLK